MTSTASWPVSAITSATVRALPAQVLRAPEGARAGRPPSPPRSAYARAAGRELGADAVARGPVGEALLERSRAAGLDPLRQLDEQARATPTRRDRCRT